jgi:hypothetical protein
MQIEKQSIRCSGFSIPYYTPFLGFINVLNGSGEGHEVPYRGRDLGKRARNVIYCEFKKQMQLLTITASIIRVTPRLTLLMQVAS